MEQDDEQQLIQRCRKGEASAWDELFDQYYPAVARFIFQLSPRLSREDTEEIGQETFLAAIRNLDSFKGESAFQTWIFRIAANKTRDFFEKQNALKRGGGMLPISLNETDPETGLTLEPPGDGPDPGSETMAKETCAMLRDALDRLGGPCREILELRYFGDLGYDELSRTLKLNPKTVSSRLSKCLDRLEKIVRKVFSKEKPGAFPSNP